MSDSYLFELTRPAKKTGADRYEVRMALEAKPVAIYIPQSISRMTTGYPARGIKVTFEIVEED